MKTETSADRLNPTIRPRDTSSKLGTSTIHFVSSEDCADHPRAMTSSEAVTRLGTRFSRIVVDIVDGISVSKVKVFVRYDTFGTLVTAAPELLQAAQVDGVDTEMPRGFLFALVGMDHDFPYGK